MALGRAALRVGRSRTALETLRGADGGEEAMRRATVLLGGGKRAERTIRSAASAAFLSVFRPAALERAMPGLSRHVRQGADGMFGRASVAGATPARGLRWAHVRDLTAAESAANAAPGNIAAQVEYLALLNRTGMGSEVIKRVESGRFVSGPETAREYARALVAEGRAAESDFDRIVAAHSQPAMPQSYASGMSQGGFAGLATPGAPGMAAYGAPGGGFAPPPQYHPGFAGGGGGDWGFGGPGRLGSEEHPLVVRPLPASGAGVWLGRLLTAAFWVAIIYFFFVSRGSSGGSPLEAITGSGQNEPAEVPDTRFEDVKGVDEAKNELMDLVHFLREPEKFSKLGAKIPKGVLLTGPPGTGKTLLARAVAGEAGVRFYAKSASEFEEMLVGLGARRVRDLFAQAKANAPAIIFIDEIDAMGAKRGRVSLGAGSERQTLNQLLACMDGFTKSENVIVIAATNNPEILDNALTRPGRFDTSVSVPLPDIRGRREILELYLSQIRASPRVDAGLLAAATPGMSGATLEAMVNQAALIAANAGKAEVGPEELEEARDKVWMGPALRSRQRKMEELELTAWHEGGHTLAGLLTEGARELHKVTILARGNAGGVTFFLDAEDQMLTRRKILAQIDVAMGGRVAEEIKYGPQGVTTGAGQDMQQASHYARLYVKSFSMGDMGLSTFDDSDPKSAPSPETQRRIDVEVEKLLRDSYARVSSLLHANRDALERLAGALMEHETLTADECRAVALRGETLPPPLELAAARRTAQRKTFQAEEGAAADAKDETVDAPAATGLFSWMMGGATPAPADTKSTTAKPSPRDKTPSSPTAPAKPTPQAPATPPAKTRTAPTPPPAKEAPKSKSAKPAPAPTPKQTSKQQTPKQQASAPPKAEGEGDKAEAAAAGPPTRKEDEPAAEGSGKKKPSRWK